MVIYLTAPGSVRRFVRLYGARPSISAAGFLAMFVYGLGLVLVFLAFAAVGGRVGLGENADAARLGVTLTTALLSILLASIVAIPEELVFRGFFLSYLRWNASAAVTAGAVLTSALIFAVAHNLADPLDWLTADDFPLLVGLFALGLLLAAAYLATRSLWCPIGLHAALVAFNLGILQEKVIAVDYSPWWLGGSDDIRKAPLVWLVFIVASLVLVAARGRLRRKLAIEAPTVGVLTSE
jgi:membrane protease YdiL (CAAX protease family)